MTDITRIPLELRQHKGWLVWKLKPGKAPGDKPIKVPYCVDGSPRRGVQGSAEDRARLATFDDACRVLASGGWAGLGFAMMPEWGIVGLDFDHCLDESGNVIPEMWPDIWPVIAGTYAEVSPSGRGLRAFVVGVAEDRKAPAADGAFGFETFFAKGFLTVTGHVLSACEMLGHDEGLAVANGALSHICASRFGGAVRVVAPARAPAEDWPRVRSALEYIALGMWDWPAHETLDRKKWLSQVIFGTHFASGGSDEGRTLAWAASAELPGFDAKAEADFDTAWANADSEREGAKASGDSVAHLARLLGWSDPARTLSADTFDVVVPDAVPPGAPAPPPDLPRFTRDRNGVILPTVTNAVLAARRPDLLGVRVGLDSFRDEIMVADEGAPMGDGWRPMKDADLVGMRMRLESTGFKNAPKELARDAVVLVCEENTFDSAQMWLERIGGAGKWDGVSRVDRFLIDRFGCADTPYVRACGRYLWTAFAGRILDPGCQADMILTLSGDQGERKSSAVAKMVPGPEFAIEVDFSQREEDVARSMRGVLVGEVAELRGLRSKDAEGIKKFITRRWEKWIPKYKEFATTFPRRSIFVGTVNPDSIGFLGDETGERRWLPVDVRSADVEGIEADREQLWAEGAAMWRAGGVAWQDAERLAREVHAKYTTADMWDSRIQEWGVTVDELTEGGVSEKRTENQGRGYAPEGFTLEALALGIGLGIKDMGMPTQKRLGAILRKLGFERRYVMFQGCRGWRWYHNSVLLPPLLH